MTNGEKFKEVFGYEPATDAVVCNKEDWCGASEPCNYCISNPNNIGREEDWWNAEYKEPTTRNCLGCKYSKDNHNAGTEECHLCMWENQYPPTTKNDLGVDCISREQAKAAIRDKFKDLPSRVEINTILNELPSVTPQEPRWIPVSERLPNWNTECLVIDEDNECGVGYYREDAHAWDSPNWGWLERKR